jgi:gamma-glutamyltranspeptidase/glutathione hydrolase
VSITLLRFSAIIPVTLHIGKSRNGQEDANFPVNFEPQNILKYRKEILCAAGSEYMETSCSYKNGMVASGHRFASEAGVEVLRRGGNAIDAIVTTSLTLSAILPPFSGIGGGGFLMLYLASEDRVTFVDYREVAPSKSTADMYLVDEVASNSVGHLAIAVPGTIRGLSYALQKYGSIDLSDALKPGIEHARRGVVVTKTLRRATEQNIRKLEKFSRSRNTFLREGNKPYDVGSHIAFPELSLTYEKIAKSGEDEFYGGSISQQILEESERNGGILRESDFSGYEPVEREPVRLDYKNYQFILAPPPSAGGIQIAQSLLMLEELGREITGISHNSYEYLLVLSKILETTFTDRNKNLSDPDFLPVDVGKLLSKEHLASIAPIFGHLPLSPNSSSDSHSGRSTTHMCAVDKEGNIAALTESIECFYGSGVVAGETGVLLNDTMHDFDINPSSPNSVAPGKTPVSSMSPTIVCKDSRPFLTCGSAGGRRIISATLQTVLNVILFGMTIQQAIDSARFHFEGSKFIVESRIDSKILEKLNKDAGYDIELVPDYDLALGGVQGIMIDDAGGISGGADPRREAAVSGF